MNDWSDLLYHLFGYNTETKRYFKTQEQLLKGRKHSY